MKRTDRIAKQSGNPKGILGKVIGFIMSFETREINRIAIDLLNLKPGDKVLEVGFGHGKTIRDTCRTTEIDAFCGIDISETMLNMAQKINKSSIEKNLVDLKLANVENIPYQDNYFDKVLTVHTIYFWKDIDKSFKELYRVIKPEGRLVIGFRYDKNAKKSFPEKVYTFRSENEISSMLKTSGFNIEECRRDISEKRSLYWLVASKLT